MSLHAVRDQGREDMSSQIAHRAGGLEQHVKWCTALELMKRTTFEARGEECSKRLEVAGTMIDAGGRYQASGQGKGRERSGVVVMVGRRRNLSVGEKCKNSWLTE